MKRLGMIFFIFGAIGLALGCASRTRVADLTIMASKNVSSLEGAKVMGVFEGKACKGVWTGQIPSQEDALDEAVESGGGNAMIDAVIYFKPGNCLFDKHCWEIKGTVIKTKDLLGKSMLLENLLTDETTSGLTEYLTSKNGNSYIAVRKPNTDLEYDKTHYDLIIRVP